MEGTGDSKTVARLGAAFRSSRNPMLIVDDQRRWVTGNSAAFGLLGVGPEEIAWHTMDDFIAVPTRPTLEEQWTQFLASGAVEGWVKLLVGNGSPVELEFSAAANWLPARHLAIFMNPDSTLADPSEARELFRWRPARVQAQEQEPLTPREREVMTLVAEGCHTTDLGERLYVSPETVKSHVKNAMKKLNAHTRAHAVAIALMTGQISWEQDLTG